MAEYYQHLSALFDPGAGNVQKALEIYKEMRKRNRGYFTVKVEKDGGQLRIRHNNRNPAEADVVGHATAFVAECARQFNLGGTWSGRWSNDQRGRRGNSGGIVMLDLATQAVARAYDMEALYEGDLNVTALAKRDQTYFQNNAFSLAETRLAEAVSRIGSLPIVVKLGPTDFHEETLFPIINTRMESHKKWLHENIEDNWGYVSRIVGVDEEEHVLRFETDTAAVSFKFRFG